MAKDDTTPGGIFSKVVKFVRNPGTNWSELDQKESDRESAYSKQALKEMIERKRRNDFVRKREFDMLRKLRRREAMGGAAGDASVRPSFFQSSMPSKPDDRAMTLKKIDEIEAQMSMQWWKTKHGAPAGPSTTSGFTNSDISIPSSASSNSGHSADASKAKLDAQNKLAYARTAPDDLTNSLAASVAKIQDQRTAAAPVQVKATASSSAPAPATPANAGAATATSAAAAAPVIAPTLAAKPAKAPLLGGLVASYEGGGTTGFSASKLFAMDVDEVQHDPELEEAAIRFANGDDAGAEAGLLEVLGAHGRRSNHEETWFTAFDLYRATGQHDRFENLAISFASKFNRSAPMWFSIPEMVGKLASAAPVAPLEGGRSSDWRSPANFGVQTLAAMNAAMQKAPMPWVMDWSALKTIEDNAVIGLVKLFGNWAVQPVQLRFMGAHVLDEVLRTLAPSGVREVSQDIWKLRLEHLRVTHRPDEFELTALDFCVTYELSPPAWESAKCEYKLLDTDGVSGVGQTIIGEAMHDSILSEFSSYEDSQMGRSSLHAQHLTEVELAGQIQGDPVAVLEKLETRLAGADVMVISCSKLIRVDFSAAGTLLNWVSARQTEGRLVQFTNVHRLVAAFFHVIGISEHAKVISRVD